MARISWGASGERFFEAGVDRGVLYVGSNPGVPWIGLIDVEISASGGEAKPRYMDGVKISNHASPEDFEGRIEAYSYPTQFEPCDGTARLQHGLRATRQHRRSFGMSFRTLIGNENEGTDLAYKIHILYNLLAEPTDRKYQTLSQETEPLVFSWNVTARPEVVQGLMPTAHFSVDSRDIPQELLAELENILYGDSTRQPSLPSAGELIFLFDSYQDEAYDAGTPYTPVFLVHDAGGVDTPVTLIIDGGEL